MIKANLLLVLAAGCAVFVAGGCGSAPAVATEEESQQSMDATLSFDPMTDNASDAAADPATP